jgi:hypothetical protein
MACLDGACLHSLLCAYDGTQRFIERKVYNLRRVRRDKARTRKLRWKDLVIEEL